MSITTLNADTLSDILRGEQLISLTAAGKSLPGHRGNQHVNAATIWRWCHKGVRTTAGQVIKLEAVRVGWRWLTSREALSRFVTALTAGSTADKPTPPATIPITSPSARARRAEAATNELDQLLGTGDRSAA